MNSVLTTKRRRWALAGVGGALFVGGLAIAGGTAFAAGDDDSTVDQKADPTITAVDAADAAQDELPDCDVASIVSYDMDATTPVWNVEMTCSDGTTQYVEIDGTDGSLISINDDYSVGDDATSGDDAGTGSDDGSADVDTDAASSVDK